MYDILDKINCPADVKQLSFDELKRLAEEVRHFMIDTVSLTGGHLASSLGVVELTLAIYQAFDLPQDKIVWDVGHQTYAHKILTGRKEQFHTLRQYGGLSGFPKAEESEYDVFNTGHSSTSISAALGLCEARNLSGEGHYVAAVIGDGALTGGMAYEALNDAGPIKKNFIVILNDNEMSISKNVGGISTYLTKIRSKPGYYKMKARMERILLGIPGIGRPILGALKKLKDNFRHLLTSTTIFEDLGFTYFGPIDGHDMKLLRYVLESAKRIQGPVLVHVLTKKGKGYRFAEESPAEYHGINRFDIESGMPKSSSQTENYSLAFGKELVSLAEEVPSLCAISAAMPIGTGLSDFAEKYPERFFDAGIAEQHAVTFAAGLSKGGYTPVFAVYSSFLQRAYDQLLHDVCLQNLHIVFCVDRAGIVGEDGETHQGVYDISFLSAMPNMTVLAPANFTELGQMLRYAATEHQGPIAIRYPRGSKQAVTENAPEFKLGVPHLAANGKDACILAAGTMLKQALEAKELLENEGLDIAVLNLRTLSPLDEETVRGLAETYPLLVSLEDGVRRGGVGEAVASILTRTNQTAKLLIKAHENPVVPHGAPALLYEKCRLDARSVADDILKKLRG
ncbi:MAG: 1-deoxy-D-xylulose-5-phosphate synthase [Clostridia bacterium]|nr:1-deoxy-D-xylulose-5-phosphate synthase [Clostridia bacterium]